MIKNLVTSGCSFTAGNRSWARIVSDSMRITNFFNMGSGGAGNRYIASSVIDAIEYNNLEPQETLVLVMWSGLARFDQPVSGKYWYLLPDYSLKTKYNDFADTYWISSGGLRNAWLDHPESVKIFQNYYMISDPFSLCKATLENISRLENYLENKGFRYYFMSYVNCWSINEESGVNGDYSLAYFAKNLPSFQKMRFDNWIFCNEKKDGLYEFCKDNNSLGQDQFHPDFQGQKQFAEKIILPVLRGI